MLFIVVVILFNNSLLTLSLYSAAIQLLNNSAETVVEASVFESASGLGVVVSDESIAMAVHIYIYVCMYVCR